MSGWSASALPAEPPTGKSRVTSSCAPQFGEIDQQTVLASVPDVEFMTKLVPAVTVPRVMTNFRSFLLVNELIKSTNSFHENYQVVSVNDDTPVVLDKTTAISS
jgi:hypothetical protein